MMSKEYNSRGKLLISGEYLILHGAVALAIPVRFGQKMFVTSGISCKTIDWNTKVLDKSWFTAKFSLPDFAINSCTDRQPATYVQKVLQASQKLNKDFLTSEQGYQVECQLDFDIEWGLGSSSSLISNVAYWANVDPLELHTMVSKGSGYDVLCARAPKPGLFEIRNGKRLFDPVGFNPPFSGNIYFVYLGKKKDSQVEVDAFLKNSIDYQRELSLISTISREMAACSTMEQFGQLMREHEEIMSDVLKKPTLKSAMFSDFAGEIKSLGAWGGDFAMILWTGTRKQLTDYLVKRDLHVCYSFKEMIYEPNAS